LRVLGEEVTARETNSSGGLAYVGASGWVALARHVSNPADERRRICSFEH
jgi:hypothetical protein